MRGRVSAVVLSTACAAMIFGSTAAAAAPAPAPATSSAANPWLTLSQMNSTGAAALGSAAVAAQPADYPPPAPGLRVTDRDVIPWPVLGFWLVVIAAMIIIAMQNDNNTSNGQVISPA